MAMERIQMMLIVSFHLIVLNLQQPLVSFRFVESKDFKSRNFEDLPVLEDGLSDSENNESATRKKPAVNIPSHKQQYAKTPPAPLVESSTTPAGRSNKSKRKNHEPNI